MPYAGYSPVVLALEAQSSSVSSAALQVAQGLRCHGAVSYGVLRVEVVQLGRARMDRDVGTHECNVVAGYSEYYAALSSRCRVWRFGIGETRRWQGERA